MNLFGRRQGTHVPLEQRLASLEIETAKLASALRQLEGEQMLMHDQVRKWMRRAVAAERNQEPRGETSVPTAIAPATPVLSRRATWGARGRRLMRRAEEPIVQAFEDLPPGINGED